MKLSDMISSYLNNPKLKAKLKQDITLDDGTVFKRGTISEILIEKKAGKYHFEAQNNACTVNLQEIEFIT